MRKFRANSYLQLTRTFYKMERKMHCKNYFEDYEKFTQQKLSWKNKRQKPPPVANTLVHCATRAPHILAAKLPEFFPSVVSSIFIQNKGGRAPLLDPPQWYQKSAFSHPWNMWQFDMKLTLSFWGLSEQNTPQEELKLCIVWKQGLDQVWKFRATDSHILQNGKKNWLSGSLRLIIPAETILK